MMWHPTIIQILARYLQVVGSPHEMQSVSMRLNFGYRWSRGLHWADFISKLVVEDHCSASASFLYGTLMSCFPAWHCMFCMTVTYPFDQDGNNASSIQKIQRGKRSCQKHSSPFLGIYFSTITLYGITQLSWIQRSIPQTFASLVSLWQDVQSFTVGAFVVAFSRASLVGPDGQSIYCWRGCSLGSWPARGVENKSAQPHRREYP